MTTATETQLSYAHNPGEAELSGLSVGEHLRRVVGRQPDRPAIVIADAGEEHSYAQLWEDAEAAARAMLAQGVGRGDRVALWSGNRYEWVVVQLAVARIGAILVCVNPAYVAAELAYVLGHSSPRLLVLSAAFRSHEMPAILAAAEAEGAAVERAVVIDSDWAAFCAAGEEVPPAALADAEALTASDDALSILYTSGTTGAPKGATLTHHNALNNALLTCGTIGLGAEDRVCLPPPFFHCFGCITGILGCLGRGATVILPGTAFDPLKTLEAVHEHRCTGLYGVPTMFVAECSHERFAEFDLSSLRTGLIGGAPCAPELIERIRDSMHLPELSIISGMTETSPTATQTVLADTPEQRTNTVGRPSASVEVKVVDAESGETVPVGSPGEMCTRGYHVMCGYWEDEEATRLAIDADGWMHTGDLATMDAEGYVQIVGRIKDVIIRGGENVYPREVEDVLLTHAAVIDAQVIGVPDPVYGEQVTAWVRLHDPGCATEELREHCAARLSTPKVPVEWRVVDEFPQTASGKVQKFRMREIAVAELEEGRP